MTENATHAYIGIAACGCIRAATADDPDQKKEVAKDVASFLRWGKTVERVSVESVRITLCTSNHGPKNRNCPHPNACPLRNNLAA